nr:pseudouridine-5'-phosphate glycosidase [Candidatus Neomarinimicrobiota bacterium]
MKTSLLHFSSEVSDAISSSLPILALESTIISHGMPYPDNLEFAQQAENIARKQGVVPATIAII